MGGPCTSYELVAHDQTEVAFCGRDTASLRLFKETLSTSYYHISLTHDVIGLESAVALKNAYALAVAMTIGLVNRHHGADAGLHYNSQAGAFYQAVREIIGNTTALRELASAWTPANPLPAEELERLFCLIDKSID